MTSAAKLRETALALPKVLEKPHFDRSGFRVDVPKGRMFMTLAGDGRTANLKLTREEQDMLCAAEPGIFAPVPNKWGENGWTVMTLKSADAPTLKSALTMAWRGGAPEKHHGLLD